MLRLIPGMIVGVLLLVAGVFAWFQFGHPPVAVADAPFPHEEMITSIPLKARIHREMITTPPLQANEANLASGAHLYRQQCAACHGLYSQHSSFGQHMYPPAPSLWEKHANNDVVGVSDDAPGETYWKVANGIRLTGMPAYKAVMTEAEMWQVSLLLANADKPLPPSVIDLIRQPLPVAAPTSPATPPALPRPTGK